MFSLIKRLKELVPKIPQTATRDRREFYASEALAPQRDLFWKFKGEPETNPTDFVGAFRMLCGDSIEKGLKEQWLNKLHVHGLHLVDYQVKVGGSNPSWNGFVDFYIAHRRIDGSYEKVLVELKTKWGAGGDFLMSTLKPSEEHLTQLGLYLDDFDKVGKPIDGILYYIILSDNHFGSMVEFHCRYIKETSNIHAYKVITSEGISSFCDYYVDIGAVKKRMIEINEKINLDILPDSDYTYKHTITPEFLKDQSDANLRSMLSGRKVIGDWQIAYSRFKDKHLALNGQSQGYTPEEMKLIANEYKSRHPKSKLEFK